MTEQELTDLAVELAKAAPPWAVWLAFDADGMATYFEHLPHTVNAGGFWATRDMVSRFDCDFEQRTGFAEIWRKTLFKIKYTSTPKLSDVQPRRRKAVRKFRTTQNSNP